MPVYEWLIQVSGHHHISTLLGTEDNEIFKFLEFRTCTLNCSEFVEDYLWNSDWKYYKNHSPMYIIATEWQMVNIVSFLYHKQDALSIQTGNKSEPLLFLHHSESCTWWEDTWADDNLPRGSLALLQWTLYLHFYYLGVAPWKLFPLVSVGRCSDIEALARQVQAGCWQLQW